MGPYLPYMKRVSFYIPGLALLLLCMSHFTAAGSVPASEASNASSTEAKTIFLTFDDGPYGTSTEEVLQILKSKGVHATFFVIGKNVLEYPDEARQIVADGSMIGNHSYDHSRKLARLSKRAFARNLNKAEAIIASTTGSSTPLFRPPYGNLSRNMKIVLREEGYTTELWNDDVHDWNKNVSSTTIVRLVLLHAKPQTILLLHDGRDTHVNYPRDNMIQALPAIIDEFKARGYTFGTL